MDEEIEIKDYFRMIKANWLLSLIIFVLVLSGAVIFTLNSQKLYEARSLVMISAQDQTSQLLGGSTIRIDVETQREIIMSTSVLDPVYTEYGANSFLLQVNPLKNTNILEIIVQSTDPNQASDIANKIADSYSYYNKDSRRQGAKEVSEFITEQLDILESEVDELNREILIYSVRDRGFEEEQLYQSLLQSLAAKQSIYEQLLSRREEVGIAAQEKSGNIKVIEYSMANYAPVKPDKFLNIGLGVILAFVLAFGIAIAKQQSSNSFSNVKEIEQGMDQKITGVLPFIKKMKRRKFMVVGYDMYPKLAESIRRIRANLMLKGNLKVFSVTSPKTGEGKSMVAVNLAISLIGTGKRVLLIDANLRNPVLDRALNVKQKVPGLAEVLITGKLKVRQTKHENLYLLPAGKITKSSIDVISTERIRHICNQLESSDFDVVIFDNSSMDYAESTIFSANTKVLLVISDKTTKEDAILAKETLVSVGADVVGLVWNRK